MSRIKSFLESNKWLLLILMLGSFLRLFHLGYQSIWLDEIFTMFVSDPSLSFDQFNYEMILREGFPYLYFYILHFFYAIFGYTEVAARLVSALGGIASIYAIYLLGRELINKNVGLFAALILALSEYNIYISQDARPYSLYVFATILCFWRLSVFIKNISLRNALYYGLSAGLLINLNFFGFINILSHVFILVFFISIFPRDQKWPLFKFSAIAGVLALLLFLPNYKILEKLLNFKSFWVPPPTSDAFSILYHEFLGNSELTTFIFSTLIIYYFLELFRRENAINIHAIGKDKFQYSFVFFAGWGLIFTMFLWIKSYLDISLFLPRYFTSLTPVLFLIIACGIYFIKNRLVQLCVLGCIILFMLINLFIVKDYYYKISKTQYREITKELLTKNHDNDKVVSSWGYLFNYFLKADTKRNTIEKSLDLYVQEMMSEKIDNSSFWYIDGNGRPYNLTPEMEAYLNENFDLIESLEYYDTWAKHYKSKSAPSGISFLTLPDFQPSFFDGSGAMMFVQNMKITYPPINLALGQYEIVVHGKSLPEQPLNGENAHFKIYIDNVELGNFYLSNEVDNGGSTVKFYNPKDRIITFQIEYDNDEVVGEIDRNALIHSIQIKKN